MLPKLSAHQLVEAMDPLTFFSMFNGKRRNAAKRAEAVSRIAGAMGIDVEVPSGFEGVPLTNAQKWRFWDGGPGTIGNNWGLFRAAVAFADGPDEDKGVGPGRLFDVVHAQGNIGDATLTMVLFWARPRSYLPLESQFAVKALTEVTGWAIE